LIFHTSQHGWSVAALGASTEKRRLGTLNLLANSCDGGKIVETTSKAQFDAINIKSNGKSRLKTLEHNLKTHLSISIATILALSAPGIVKAQFSFTASVGGVPDVSGATLENFDEPSPSILTLSGSAWLVTGTAANGEYTAPFFSGSTAAYFGETPAFGSNATPYVAIWHGGTATLNFSSPQYYLGLLWVVNPDNYLTFYDSANNVIGTVELVPPPLLPGAPFYGSLYMGITSTIPFSHVVATDPVGAFDFDDVAYAMAPVPPPTIVGATMLGNGAFQFTVTNVNPSASFTVLSTTNLSLPLTNWTVIGTASNIVSGQSQFTDMQATNTSCFYTVRSP
jgi:hypothetical protein